VSHPKGTAATQRQPLSLCRDLGFGLPDLYISQKKAEVWIFLFLFLLLNIGLKHLLDETKHLWATSSSQALVGDLGILASLFFFLMYLTHQSIYTYILPLLFCEQSGWYKWEGMPFPSWRRMRLREVSEN